MASISIGQVARWRLTSVDAIHHHSVDKIIGAVALLRKLMIEREAKYIPLETGSSRAEKKA